jgi:serine/threonine protein kinase/tetratricopeptide (TPR) repeat protein
MADLREDSTNQQPNTDGCGMETMHDLEPSRGDESETASATLASTGNSPMIGNYRIIREIGKGGMGIVYEAEQQEPKRLVALKVIQGTRLLDDYNIKLFEREAQALARLKHPGIAAIYESGRTQEGQHFFAMELVRGDTLEVYLRKSADSGTFTPQQLREKLAIFRKISDAITYAHQRGVIHRDLKPSNIIVQREFDSSDSSAELHVPSIKILDFGLARITETDLAVATIGTEIGQIQGTLPYMSPEQVRGNPDEIDVRSDVYSLGVILYEMIAGRRPYDVHHAMLHEAARIICEIAPTPLSKSWSGTKRLDRDIETIVGKALEKEAPRRYQSVAAMSEDVFRFLTGQPILARPPSSIYQLRKMAARHKLGFAFAALLLVLITVFSIGISFQARRIARERDRANREAKTAQQVSEFLVSLFQVSDPFEGKGKDVTAREILEAGSGRIASELQDQPEVRATLLNTMGRVYRNLGLYDKAIELVQAGLRIREQRLGPDNIETAKSLDSLGALKLDKADYGLAETLMRRALEIRINRLGTESAEVAESYNNLSSVEFEKGNWTKSEVLVRRALAIQKKALGENTLEVANSLNNLAIVLQYEDKLAESEPLYQEALTLRRRLLGADHPFVAQSINNLAMLYLRVQNFAEAEKLFREALASNQRAFGDEHPEVAANLNNLALLNLQWKRLPQAELMYRQVVAIDQKNLGENNPALSEPIQSLGVVLTREKKFPEAEECLRKAISLKLLRFQENHWQVATARNLLGACLFDRKKYKDAEPLLVQSYGIIKAQFGMKHERTRRAASRLIDLYNATGKRDMSAALEADLASEK